MNIYELCLTEAGLEVYAGRYDALVHAVVISHNETDARRMAEAVNLDSLQYVYGNKRNIVWMDDEDVSCKMIGVSVESQPRVVVADMNPG